MRTIYLSFALQVWDAISDGTIYSCPSLLSSFSAICFADLKKYKFTYHFAYPALHSDPQWKLKSSESGNVKLTSKETTMLVEKVQTWKYSVDTRQHGFFLAKRLRKSMFEQSSSHVEDTEEPGSREPTSPLTPFDDTGFVWVVGSLASYETGFFENVEEEDRFVCFADPSTYPSNPGWMLRNLLVLVRQRWKLSDVQILCYRDTHPRREHPHSVILTLQCGKESSVSEIPATTTSASDKSSNQLPDRTESSGSVAEMVPKRTTNTPPVPKITGWERNEQNKIVSRTVDLAAYLDPTRLADQAVDLNLKLIKWRIAPSIDLDIIKNTKCLLLGAGTLGSYVARNLMGWGVRKITFVDNARVSFSNPVRQPLYTFKDCLEGGARKAERAAEALKEIYPGVDATGHVMSVPMAGHPIMDEAKVREEYEKLHSLVESHDAIFLLMDTRESRWLPTVMAKAAGKIVINSALGFDTYVVMRHGVRLSPPAPKTPEIKAEPPPPNAIVLGGGEQATYTPSNTPPPMAIRTKPAEKATDLPEQEGEELGCYFCSDVVAPADSLKSATLDQQCTVTRPGVAPLASALAVELLVSTLQSPLKARTPAPVPATVSSQNSSSNLPSEAERGAHPLGTVPHQLRGFLANWSTLPVKVGAYDCCSACSKPILEAYERDGWEFVKRAVNEKGFVEEVSGLAEVQRRAEEVAADVEWSEEEDEDGEGEII